MKTGFIGAGKVGCSLGKYLAVNGMELSGYYSRSPESACEAAAFTDSEAFSDLSALLDKSDAVFITVPDNSICKVYQSLTAFDLDNKLICHCSGALSAKEAFPDIRKFNAEGYSIHPLFPISSRFESYENLKNAFFCIEGDPAHIGLWQTVFENAGNRVKIISSDIKNKYHAACAISSNLVCALIYESISLLNECGFSESEAADAIRPLVMSNIERIFEVGAINALTGPVERNDTGTVQKHLGCLRSGTDSEMYRAVSKKLIELAQQKHPDTDYSELYDKLDKTSHL